MLRTVLCTAPDSKAQTLSQRASGNQGNRSSRGLIPAVLPERENASAACGQKRLQSSRKKRSQTDR